METDSNIKALMIIVNAGFSEEVIDITHSCGAQGATIINARGSGNRFKSFLGISYEPQKEMIISLVAENVATAIMAEIKNRLGVETAASGICFTMPVERMTTINKQKLTKE